MKIPLSLYIHIPWCIRKCPYCDFNSYAQTAALPEADYIKILLADLDKEKQETADRTIHSIFFGGGTPSLFSISSLEKILQGVKKRIPLSPDCEITLEANPGTLEHRNFNEYAAIGINRISLGVQSFDPEKLKTLGRIHSEKEAYNALAALQKSSIHNFNIDLMYGLPEQTVEQALFDLHAALQFSPRHISWYNLTIEPNTIFYAKPPTLPPEDKIFEIENAGLELLEASGFKQYEVSAFSRENFHCAHNKNYWEFGDYIGIGAGAHGKITQISPNNFSIKRRAKKRVPNSYLHAENLIAEEKTLFESDRIFEFMLNALRLNQGFSTALFEQRTNLSIDCIQKTLEKLTENNLLCIKDNQIKATPFGRRYLNTVLEQFLPQK